MIEKETAFVIGAGGSCPYCFPDGAELRKNILVFNNDYQKILKSHFQDLSFEQQIRDELKKSEEFSKQLYRADCSIDLFLTRNQNWKDIGRMAIANFILKAEANSSFSENMKEEKNKYNWYSLLFHALTRRILNPTELNLYRNNRVTFITFNYDRSLEHFLFTRLCANFCDSDKQYKADVLSAVQFHSFYHVYGALGKLPWQTHDKNVVNYGESICYSGLQLIKENIGVMHDSRGTIHLEAIMSKLLNAERIFFLGFAFADENINMLNLKNIINQKRPNIYATAMNQTPNEIKKIKDKIAPDLEENQVFIKDMDCVQLLRNYL